MTVRDSITRARARTPGAEDYPTSKAAHDRMLNPTQCGIIEFTTMCAKDRHKPNTSRRMPGAGLNQWCAGRCCPTCRPSSRIGENPPYGMIGRVEETSASFEARSAPRLAREYANRAVAVGQRQMNRDDARPLARCRASASSSLRFRGFPAYCATSCHVALPVANELNLPYREGRCAAQQNWAANVRIGSCVTSVAGPYGCA